MHIGAILMLTGLLTAGAAVVFFAPELMLRVVFGIAPADAMTTLVARHWGLLVALVGVLLVLASSQPELRVPVMSVAIVEKVAIAALIAFSQFRNRPVAIAVAAADATMAALYVLFLVSPTT